MRGQSGFTFIEIVAASVISTFVGLALLTVLHFTNEQIEDGTANVRLVRMQTVASEQIRRSARAAVGVRGEAESWGAIATASTDPGSPSVLDILFCEKSGAPLSGYRIDEGMLKEWDTGTFGWKPFLIAGDTVKLDTDNSWFDILPKRAGVSMRITYLETDGSKTYTFPLITETVRCRNAAL